MADIQISSSWRDRWDELVGRRRDGLLLPALVVLVLLIGAVFAARPTPAQVAPPARETAGSGGVMVHIAGAVRRPGLYELGAGARVADAIEAAGGARRARALHSVNLARLVVDGEMIVLATAPTVASATPPGAPAPVNLNVADAAALETIPGIGPVRAAAILAHRAEIGAFTEIGQLMDVSGIGPAMLESIRPYVTL